MTDRSDDSSHHRAASLLKGAAVLFAILGLSFIAWVGDKWSEFPEARASQFGFEAPLWPALGGFVILAIIAVVTLFWKAAGRVQRGEDLFSQRHRRRPGGETNANGRAEQ